jgi:hypothetical protein
MRATCKHSATLVTAARRPDPTAAGVLLGRGRGDLNLMTFRNVPVGWSNEYAREIACGGVNREIGQGGV